MSRASVLKRHERLSSARRAPSSVVPLGPSLVVLQAVAQQSVEAREPLGHVGLSEVLPRRRERRVAEIADLKPCRQSACVESPRRPRKSSLSLSQKYMFSVGRARVVESVHAGRPRGGT